MVSLTQLEVLIAVVETGGFSGAAKKLYIACALLDPVRRTTCCPFHIPQLRYSCPKRARSRAESCIAKLGKRGVAPRGSYA
jgi:hypothetical protein